MFVHSFGLSSLFIQCGVGAIRSVSSVMLRKLVTKTDLSLAVAKTSACLPQSSTVHYSLQFQIQDRLPELKFRNYAFPWPEPSCFCVVATVGQLQLPYIYVADKDTKTMEQFFALLVNAEPELCGTYMVGSVQDDVQKFMRTYFDESWCGCCESDEIVSNHKGTFAYYMTTEQVQQVKEMQIEAPDGFYWDKLGENDLTTVTGTWRFQSKQGESALPSTRIKTNRLPNVCLRENKSHSLACFEMVDFFGWMNHLHTMTAFRRQGLATAVELKLAQELISQDVVPFKFIVPDNEAGIIMSEKSKFWSQMPSIVHWLRVKMNSSS